MRPKVRAGWLLGVACVMLTATAQGQFQIPTAEQLQGFQPAAVNAGQDDAPISVQATFSIAAAGQPARLFVTAEIKSGWHVYSITQPKGGPLPSKIKLATSPAYRTLGEFNASPPAAVHRYPDAYGDLPVEEHQSRVTWYVPIELSAGSD